MPQAPQFLASVCVLVQKLVVGEAGIAQMVWPMPEQVVWQTLFAQVPPDGLLQILPQTPQLLGSEVKSVQMIKPG